MTASWSFRALDGSSWRQGVDDEQRQIADAEGLEAQVPALQLGRHDVGRRATGRGTANVHERRRADDMVRDPIGCDVVVGSAAVFPDDELLTEVVGVSYRGDE